MKQKILFLGAAIFQLPPLEYAKRKGYYTITCDNQPQNPGHLISDKHYITTTVDKEGILEIAKNEGIDGILTFGSDISAPTAAYVSSMLNLPGNSVESIALLTNKGLFRKFLNATGIQRIEYMVFGPDELSEARSYILNQGPPLVIKPVDSAGSKGLSVLRNFSRMEELIRYAYSESIKKEIIIERYHSKEGKQVCGDGYFENGKIKYIFFGDGHFYNDETHLVPWGETFPSTQSKKAILKAKDKIEIILKKSGFSKGHFNHDLLIDSNGDSFIIEIGPRGGGNFISEAIRLRYGVDLVADSVESSLNEDYESSQLIEESDLYYSCYMVHSKTRRGKYREFIIAPKLRKNIYSINNYLKEGDNVHEFIKGSHSIANVILRFDSFEEMNFTYNNIHEYFNVIIDEDNADI